MSFRRYKGNDWTEAGWRICNRDECVMMGDDIPFSDTAPVRAGVAAQVLEAFAYEYHRRVPGGITSSIWGWSFDNSVADSNHLGGIALDINAPQYGYGDNRMHRLFPNRVAAIEAIIRDFEGNVFWGANWTGSSKDEMHFQLGAGTATGTGASQRLIDFAARRIRDGRLVGAGSSSGPVGYGPDVTAAFAQLRPFGWA